MAQRKKTEDGMVWTGKARVHHSDLELFKRMDNQYISDAELEFFEAMHRRLFHLDRNDMTGDALICKDENPEGIWFQREYDYEFWVLTWDIKSENWTGSHLNYDSLAEVLQDPIIGTGITLWDWLRATDYKYVHYNRIIEY